MYIKELAMCLIIGSLSLWRSPAPFATGWYVDSSAGKERSEAAGIPIMKTCSKCQGRGYSRLPAEEARAAVTKFLPDLTQPTWSRNFKPLLDDLITQCHKEESSADSIFNSVTR
ncbi:hypothetical protein GRH90_24545 [Enterobacteriales bacterium SAP-6]|uniref:Uncharacterized protein n=1 Tax=Acerihabitans arboris TaxID=2691583 RepID=A0A845SYK3_9GAMM|nr:antitermination protein [Acerihabitans arboris]NDL65905.1 hypothetical protein [Acerihabitans arboris]